MRRFAPGAALAAALAFALAAPAAAGRRVIREIPLVEWRVDGASAPAAFAVDARGRVTVADAAAGCLVHHDSAGAIVGRTTVVARPGLSRFRLQDLAVAGDAYSVLETVRRRILVFTGGRLSAEVALPAECVAPLRLGFDPHGRHAVYDARSGFTLVLDGLGAVVARTAAALDESPSPRARVASWRRGPDGDERTVELLVSTSLEAPGRPFYLLTLPEPVARVSLLGFDASGDLVARIVAGYGLDLKGYLVRVTGRGVRRSLVDYPRFAEFPVPRPVLLGADGKVYAIRRFPETWLVVRLDEETDWDAR